MIFKYYSILCLVSLLNLKLYCVSGHRIERDATYKNADELDLSTITETGCKYLHLAKGESIFFTKSNGNLKHTTMASLLSDDTLVDQNQTNFEMHLAVRSAGDVHVLMFTRRQYLSKTRTQADYDIGFGVKDNQRSSLDIASHADAVESHFMKHDDTPTPDLLSADKYEKFYIKLDDDFFKFGKHCSRSMISTKELGFYQLEIVQFGFLAKADEGAKILYDCPPDFAGCKCSWWANW